MTPRSTTPRPTIPEPTTQDIDRRGLLRAGALTLPLALAGGGALALAAPVHADPSVTGGETRTRDVPLADLPRRASDQGARARVIEDAAGTMVGASWSGTEPDVLRVRGRASGAEWTSWFPLEIAEDPEDGTSLGAAEPAWLGAADEIELVAVRDGEDVSDELTAHVLTTSPREEEKDGAASSALQRMSTRAVAAGDAVELGPGAPTIVRRSAWGADESLVGSVSSASELRAVVVHHTAGSNSYAKADAPQLLRGILSYHTKTLGWADIGYNLLVDRYGTIYEGRHGGLHKHIIGAHAYGFNTFSCGVSVMGTFTSSAPPSAAISAVQKVAAWKLLGAFRTNASQQFDWVSTVTGGGSLYDEGETAHLRRIFGHRDVNATECPGNAFYPKLSGMRSNTTSAISSAWRLHLDAFASPGEKTLGTVTQLVHVEGAYYVTRLTKGFVISSASGAKDARATQFRTWTTAWGLPLAASRVVDGRRIQDFSNGQAVREDGEETFTRS
ncbi:peptidoglycan recognition protein family protein [Brachybacterium kimchii]|uniref:Peptidoglycan recognition protein n=1 Tax=Brachybacterium kimchii TaxID=2942909 RepID=A0ABY4N7S1_9MICO|nr:N-acetylmuramoyl-L-alanine amidase [Brachybacterium kimchii]UQN29812.1 peptidoglycan recognition protein [Brachybacterium kimchii]